MNEMNKRWAREGIAGTGNDLELVVFELRLAYSMKLNGRVE